METRRIKLGFVCVNKQDTQGRRRRRDGFERERWREVSWVRKGEGVEKSKALGL